MRACSQRLELLGSSTSVRASQRGSSVSGVVARPNAIRVARIIAGPMTAGRREHVHNRECVAGFEV